NHIFKYFSNITIVAYLALLFSMLIIFISNPMQLIWIIFGLVTVIAFFYFTYILNQKWVQISDRSFERKIFTTSLIIRIVYIVFIWIFYTNITGEPFEIDAADSKGYHGEALWILDLFGRNEISRYFNSYLTGYSDSGWPLFLSFIYFFTFKSIFAVRLVNAFLGSWTVILIYKLTLRNFGKPVARIAAIIAMLFPAFIYYCGLHLKETLMTLILVAFTERVDYLIRKRSIDLFNLLLIIFLGIALFFFRTVLAAAAWFSLFSALLLSSTKLAGKARRFINIIWFIIAASFVFSATILAEIEKYYYQRGSNIEDQMHNFTWREGGNILAQYGKQSIFLPLVTLGPFPSMVNTNQPNANMVNGSLFTRNILAFFVLLALWVLYKRKLLTNHILIIVMLFSYLFILSASGFALSERFHMPALPFMVILAAYGIKNISKQHFSYYIPYLIIIGIITIGWNWFKLAGRGII
ncbi:MAG: hypothetical protein GX820_08980, partial [Bacteroidales bacterium]|nr:hypothetical protein [Bacteroidales bacterium]